jgi:hypothetical protein
VAAIESGSRDEIARLLTLLIRLQLGNQTNTIVELHKLDFSAARIAELVGTTPATARATVHQQKRRSAPQKGQP